MIPVTIFAIQIALFGNMKTFWTNCDRNCVNHDCDADFRESDRYFCKSESFYGKCDKNHGSHYSDHNFRDSYGDIGESEIPVRKLDGNLVIMIPITVSETQIETFAKLTCFRGKYDKSH